jgi:hypothetical protein
MQECAGQVCEADVEDVWASTGWWGEGGGLGREEEPVRDDAEEEPGKGVAAGRLECISGR